MVHENVSYYEPHNYTPWWNQSIQISLCVLECSVEFVGHILCNILSIQLIDQNCKDH